ncbi:hypothetical protein [Fluviispira multicolorata]|uniref:Cell division protein FtsQ n=1 Tax=Fluviispira multicolorata TaxID=2654512 RepID=A0A833N1I8_9BACT|nr:hypothetical protein [Fluviispira multicolorata]KAB8030875.1 hypothetical protein GCL57_07830 [Fluviispira multicolorata]
MNGNKKQRRVNLLASQKPGPRNRKGIKKQEKTIFIAKVFFLLKTVFLKINNSIFVIYSFLKKRPRTSYILSIVVIFLIVLKVSIYYVDIYSEKILPNHIQINTDNPKITSELYASINKELIKSIKNQEKRSHFLESVDNILNSLDIVDQYWIRLGLDGKLQINAIMEIPVMIIEAKNNERYIISNNMKIIFKNPPQNEYSSLLKIEAPEVKINWHSKNYYIKLKKNRSISNVSNSLETSGPVNFPWLIKQIRLINSEIQNVGSGYSLVKISWSSQSGFSLKINRNIQMLKNKKLIPQKSETRELPSKDLTNTELIEFNALLGDGQIRDKMDRLKILLIDLSNKNIYPSEVDLDFSDKATFKILGSNPSPSI